MACSTARSTSCTSGADPRPGCPKAPGEGPAHPPGRSMMARSLSVCRGHNGPPMDQPPGETIKSSNAFWRFCDLRRQRKDRCGGRSDSLTARSDAQSPARGGEDRPTGWEASRCFRPGPSPIRRRRSGRVAHGVQLRLWLVGRFGRRARRTACQRDLPARRKRWRDVHGKWRSGSRAGDRWRCGNPVGRRRNDRGGRGGARRRGRRRPQCRKRSGSRWRSGGPR